MTTKTETKTRGRIGLSPAEEAEGRAYWMPDRASSPKISAVSAHEAALAKINETDESRPTLGDYDDLLDIEEKF